MQARKCKRLAAAGPLSSSESESARLKEVFALDRVKCDCSLIFEVLGEFLIDESLSGGGWGGDGGGCLLGDGKQRLLIGGLSQIAQHGCWGSQKTERWHLQQRWQPVEVLSKRWWGGDEMIRRGI